MPYNTIDSMNYAKDDAVIPRWVTIKNYASGTRFYGPYLTKKWQLPYHIKILLLFERKVFKVNVSRVCNILYMNWIRN